MVTKEIAMSAKHRDEFIHVRKGVKCRVNGKCKTWKTRPKEFQLPVKYGLYHCFYITDSNASEWRVG